MPKKKNKTRFWVIGGGQLQLPMIHAAGNRGWDVIVSDSNPECPGASQANTFLPIDTYDDTGHAEAASRLLDENPGSIDGVSTCGADVAHTVAAVSEVLGTGHLGLETTKKIQSKSSCRVFLDASGLGRYQPDKWMVVAADDYRKARNPDVALAMHTLQLSAHKLGIVMPFIVKPSRQRASRGITIVSNTAQFNRAIEAALSWCRNKDDSIVIESMVYGTEHSVEMIIGKHPKTGAIDIVFFNIVDREFSYEGGIPIEIGHINPSSTLTWKQREDIRHMMAQCVAAIGLQSGVLKADVVMSLTGPVILELALRLSGGFDCQSTTPLSSGRSPIDILISIASREPIRTKDVALNGQNHYAACMMLKFPESVPFYYPLPEHEAQLLAAANAYSYELLLPNGGMTPERYNNCSDRPGFCIARGSNPGQARERAMAGASYIVKHIIQMGKHKA